MRIQKTAAPRIARNRVTGQGMTEYIIIVALIAIAAVTAVSFFGAGVEGQFIKLGGAMLGAPDETGVQAAETTRGVATGNAGGASLATYGEGASGL